MKISVLITVYNRPEMLLACLRALELSSQPITEAIISDDGSDAANVQTMRKVLNECKFPVRYVRQEHNGYRLAAARNNAIRAATGDYLISIDCDILLLPDAIEAHLRRARPGLFLAGNRALLDEAGTVRAISGPISARLLDTLWETADKKNMLNMHRRFRRNLLLRRLGLAAAHKPKILGCHFSLYRADVLKVNGFDEKFVGWGLEDDDFTRRLYLAGMRGRSVILEARALHLRHQSVDSMPKTITESPNWNYFRRKKVPAYCAEGLKNSPNGGR